MEVRQCAAVFSVLVFFAVLCVSDGQQDCKSGYQCFPGGRVPEGVTATDSAYYCCPEKNTSRRSNKTADGSINCTCVPDFTLDGKMQKWADESNNEGRMCSRGAEACSGSKSNSTTNYRFLSCCWDVGGTQPVSKTVTIFDGDKEEYIGCRCNASIPSPDPTAYVVPETALYNSTGESCAYNQGCDHRPALACKYPGATFCCYGSRGMVTQNAGDSLTRCTCTNEMYGAMCESTPVPISQTTSPCLSECSDHDEEAVCRDDSGQERCCAHNMAVSVTLHNGTFTQCTCNTAGSKSCGDKPSVSPCLSECSDHDEEAVCRDDSGQERCCALNMAVSVTLHNGTFIQCTCNAEGSMSCGDTSSAPGLLQSSSLLLVLVMCASLFGV